ncbi:xanthine/uracil permease [Pseudomonas sp. JAI111]|uniref:solute carrier family 23 protein n=1 Tax=Pseudomonas sp. JAI111 TaxID=2735913 RepID=UPI002168AD31|nr:solute carrier family 23 protein [Pseudomonas sp. JAI111]MCS3838412.1 xanthine/uracil permease [Pseudomonas sp. JAI111]
MSSATSPSKTPSTVHPVDQILPVRQMLTLGLQHMAVSYIGAIAVPLIVASALKMSQADTVVLISTTLFCSGIATLLQTVDAALNGVSVADSAATKPAPHSL